MRTLDFIAAGQALTRAPSCDFTGIVAGSCGYLRARFQFSREWSGCKKVAVFSSKGQEYPVPLEFNMCEIPAEALTIATPGNLPGIPVTSGGNYTDAAGQEWVCDEVDLARGVYVQRVYSESRVFSYDEINDRHSTTLTYEAKADCAEGQGIPVLSDILPFNMAAGAGYPPVNGMRGAASSPKYVIAYYNGEEITTATVIYPLAKPMETALTDAEIQAYLALHSNKPTTTVLNDAGAHMALEYAADPKTYIDNKLAALVATNN